MSSKLKFFYFDIKNIYSEDGKYLKHYSGNGLWIKDEIDNEIYIINASANKKEKFLNLSIKLQPSGLNSGIKITKIDSFWN